jgi:hypothetical protein
MRKSNKKLDGRGSYKRALAVCFAGFCCVASSFAAARATAFPQETAASRRLLSAKDGRAIVSAARGHGQPMPGTQDCSHLVHEIYTLAGFEYQYASSFDLYAGSDSFARVKSPQPGDVIVWPGHAGIVLDPRQHTFYSLVRSGLDAEDYDSPYWKSRGKPRFFRYVVASRRGALVAKAPAASPAPGAASPHNDAAVLEERPETQSPAPKASAKTASERTAVIYKSAAPETSAQPYDVPASIVIADSRKPPTPDEVAEGISELSNAAGGVLRTDDLVKLRAPVIVFDQLSVERVEIKRDHGWAHLEIDSRVSIAGQDTDLRKRVEKIRWELRRTPSGWEAVTPLDRTYVPRDVAVRTLAAQLALLTQNDATAVNVDATLRQEAQLASLLNALLEKK